jgi:predicted N-acetyltransferase YhbS
VLEGPRGARPEELPAVVRLADTVFGEKRPHDMARWFPTLFSAANSRRLRVFSDGDRPVAMVGLTVNRVHAGGTAFTVGCIGAVCTLSEYRGQGLAGRLMEDTVRFCREEGADVLLVSGGRSLYRRMECVDAGLYESARIDRDAPLPRLAGEVREWREKDLPALAALHGREPVRFDRGPDEFLALLRTATVHTWPGRTWVVGSPAVAYLSVQEPREADGRVLSVHELGGSRTAALAALSRLFEEYGVARAEVSFPSSDVELRSILDSSGIAVAPRGFGGTVRVLDAPAGAKLATDRVRLVLPDPRRASLRTSADGASLRFEMGAESWRVEGLAEITALLFGSREQEVRMPSSGPLRAALEVLFPIPLVDYGLDYI